MLLTLTGCGTSSYEEAVKKSKPELELRGKFAVLSPEYVKFPEFPVTFRVPVMFMEDDKDTNKQRWKAYEGKAVKLTSKDPFELKNNPDSRIMLQPAYAVPPEFSDQLLNQAHQGTFLAEYKVPFEDPDNPAAKSTVQQHLMMSIWIFDMNSKLRPPTDTALLQLVKARGKESAALSKVNAERNKAKLPTDKPGSWEEDEIQAAPGSGNSSIPAKLAKFCVRSAFLHATNEQARRPVEKDGVVRLWSLKLDNRYQVFVMLRVPLEMTGETAEFSLDPTNPEADRLVDIGRAVIGSMVVTPDAAPEGEAKKK